MIEQALSAAFPCWSSSSAAPQMQKRSLPSPAQFTYFQGGASTVVVVLLQIGSSWLRQRLQAGLRLM